CCTVPAPAVPCSPVASRLRVRSVRCCAEFRVSVPGKPEVTGLERTRQA
ncbi:hypothetical protein, partial [Arthrobacter sp. DR-2P]